MNNMIFVGLDVHKATVAADYLLEFSSTLYILR